MGYPGYLSVFLILYFLNVGNGYYWYWYTTDKMKSKLLFMNRDLIMDAIRNVQRIDHLKEHYSISSVYDVGQMLYFIRSKFARMVRLLILSMENDKKFGTFHRHLPSLKEVHHLSMDIYNLIEMLEEFEVGTEQRASWMEKFMKKIVKSSQNTSFTNESIASALPFLDLDSRERRELPKMSLRNGMEANKEKNLDAAFDSELE